MIVTKLESWERKKTNDCWVLSDVSQPNNKEIFLGSCSERVIGGLDLEVFFSFLNKIKFFHLALFFHPLLHIVVNRQ